MSDKPKYMTVDDFFRNAILSTTAAGVRREIEEENQGRPVTTSEAYRAAGIDGEAWSYLGSRVVGAEG